jgi:chorismate-pyruvate lyase
MTVTVEKYHRSLVNVRVLETYRQGQWYARKILLVTKKTNRIVQFGIMRINLDLCSAAVRKAILREDTPLGRILIQRNVLRRIEPTAYLHITPDKSLMDWFGVQEPTPTYGRLAIIHCDHKPAVELLEIVTPD